MQCFELSHPLGSIELRDTLQVSLAFFCTMGLCLMKTGLARDRCYGIGIYQSNPSGRTTWAGVENLAGPENRL